MCSYTVTLWYLQWTVVWTECVGASPLRECVPSVRMKLWSFWRACRRRTWFLWTYSDICTTSMKTQAKVETASHTSNAPNVGSIDVYFASFYVQRLVQILAETILTCIHVYNLIVWRHHFQLWICKQVILCFHYKYRYCGVDFSVILWWVTFILHYRYHSVRHGSLDLHPDIPRRPWPRGIPLHQADLPVSAQTGVTHSSIPVWDSPTEVGNALGQSLSYPPPVEARSRVQM